MERNITGKVTSGFLTNIRRDINVLLEFLCENFKNVYDRKLRDFFENIFDQEKSDAIRLVDYGFARRYRKELSRTTPWATTFLIEKGYGLLDRLKRIRL
mgnify:CR=1 FL=1